MVCNISCFISMTFIIGMIFFYNMTTNSEFILQYKSSLPNDLKDRYNKITQERRLISYQGYILGFLLSMSYIFYYTKIKKDKLDTKILICITLSISFLTNYFYYILSPKSDWMLYHINSKEDTDKWLNMYKYMQYNYHLGMVFGIIGVVAMALAFRC